MPLFALRNGSRIEDSPKRTAPILGGVMPLIQRVTVNLSHASTVRGDKGEAGCMCVQVRVPVKAGTAQ
jgi:hypothetical protein